MAKKRETIVKRYKGREGEAQRAFEKDAEKLRKKGYVPKSQVYEQGRWGAGAFFLALLLCFVLIGILIFIAMLIVKPNGSLEVTYKLGSVDSKKCSQCAETVKLEAKVCRFCGYRFDGE